jgi:hypothetical protein
MGQPERGGGLGIRLDGRRRQDAGVGLEALAAQVGGQPGEAGEVALDLALRDEDPAAAPAAAPDDARIVERATPRRSASSRSAPSRSPGPGRPASSSASSRSRAASAVGPSETAERSTRYPASSAIIDSGSTCPPSMTIVCPVM